MLSEALRLLRVFHDMKQSELASRLGLSNSYVSEIEKGNRAPSLVVIDKYAEVFELPVSSIMFFAEQLPQADGSLTGKSSVRMAVASKIVNFLQLVENKTELSGQ